MRPVVQRSRPFAVAAFLISASLAFAPRASAHCDTVDGPLVREAQAALTSGEIAPVLKWIVPADEPEVRAAFSRVREVRDRGDDVRAIGDQFFLETVVRLHRQSEGAPYTGLKATGSIPPPIAAADAALDTGEGDGLADRLADQLRGEVLARFRDALARRAHAEESVEAGREYVEAYVAYMHLVERVHEIVATGVAHEHATGAAREHDVHGEHAH